LGKVEEEDILCLTDQDLIRIDSTYLNDQIKHVYLHTDRISRDEQQYLIERRAKTHDPQGTNSKNT